MARSDRASSSSKPVHVPLDDPLVVIGNSIGGPRTIEVALAPAKVKALVLRGANPTPRPEPAARDEALRLIDEVGLRPAWERYWLPLFGPSAPAELLNRSWVIASRQGEGAVSSGCGLFTAGQTAPRFLLRGLDRS